MKIDHQYYVYIVECNNKSYYIGITNHLERRIVEHNTGINKRCYTYKRRSVILKYYEYCTDIKQSIVRKKQLKGWSRKKKEALFREDWEMLKTLSKSRYK